MPLHRLSRIEIDIPPQTVDPTRAFYRDFGLAEVAPGRFATADGGEQLVIADEEAWRVASSLPAHGLASWGSPVPRAFLAPEDVMALARGT